MILQHRDVHFPSHGDVYRTTTTIGLSIPSPKKQEQAQLRSIYYRRDEQLDRGCYPSPSLSSASSGQSSPRSCSSHSFSSRTPPRSPSTSQSSTTSSVDTSSQNLASPNNNHPRSRIQVSSLLADPQPRTYRLEVVQQPQRTAEFGMNNLSRLPITPPIVVRLVIRDPFGNPLVPEGELPFLIAHLSLYCEDGTQSLDMGSQIGRDNQAPILYGNLVSSVDQLNDLAGDSGLFFLFPDVSLRWKGRYQLGVTLSRLSGSSTASEGLNVSESGIHLCHTRTMPFEVLPRSEYIAAAQTRLTQSFIRQGARMNFLP